MQWLGGGLLSNSQEDVEQDDPNDPTIIRDAQGNPVRNQYTGSISRDYTKADWYDPSFMEGRAAWYAMHPDKRDPNLPENIRQRELIESHKNRAEEKKDERADKVERRREQIDRESNLIMQDLNDPTHNYSALGTWYRQAQEEEEYKRTERFRPVKYLMSALPMALAGYSAYASILSGVRGLSGGQALRQTLADGIGAAFDFEQLGYGLHNNGWGIDEGINATQGVLGIFGTLGDMNILPDKYDKILDMVNLFSNVGEVIMDAHTLGKDLKEDINKKED